MKAWRVIAAGALAAALLGGSILADRLRGQLPAKPRHQQRCACSECAKPVSSAAQP